MADRRIKFNVFGLVQGVGFRYFVYKQAMDLNLRGYVKNYLDGSVTGIAEGEPENISTFKSLLRQGPTRARVEKVVFEEQPPENNYLQFHIH